MGSQNSAIQATALDGVLTRGVHPRPETRTDWQSCIQTIESHRPGPHSGRNHDIAIFYSVAVVLHCWRDCAGTTRSSREDVRDADKAAPKVCPSLEGAERTMIPAIRKCEAE